MPNFLSILLTRLLAAARLAASGRLENARTAANRLGISFKCCGLSAKTASTSERYNLAHVRSLPVGQK